MEGILMLRPDHKILNSKYLDSVNLENQVESSSYQMLSVGSILGICEKEFKESVRLK